MSKKIAKAKPSVDAGLEAGALVNVRKRQARSAETRANILNAATQEFAELGFDGASTRSIAKRANVLHNLVIYHFETKVGIWQAVMRHAIGWYHQAFDDRLAGLRGVDPVTTLRLLQLDFVRMAADHPELHWLMSHEAGQRGERIEWIITNLLGSGFEKWRELIVAAQEAGAYVKGDPYHLHYLFLGAAGRIFMLSAEVEKVIGRNPFDPAFVEEHAEMVQQLFFRDPPAKN